MPKKKIVRIFVPENRRGELTTENVWEYLKMEKIPGVEFICYDFVKNTELKKQVSRTVVPPLRLIHGGGRP